MGQPAGGMTYPAFVDAWRFAQAMPKWLALKGGLPRLDGADPNADLQRMADEASGREKPRQASPTPFR